MAGLTLGALAVIAVFNFSPQKVDSTLDVTQGEVLQTSTKSTDGLSSVGSIKVGQFQELFEHRSIAEQYQALYTILASATLQELKDWWTHAQNIERLSHREIAQQAILRNLTLKSPKEALQCLEEVSRFQTDALLRSVFSEWAVSNLDGAIEAVTALESSRRNVALQAILESRDDLSENRRREIAVLLDGENTYLKLVSDTKASQRITEPKESWKILLNDDVDDSQQTESLAIVAEEWREQVGFEVLSKIYAEVEDYGTQLYLLKAIAQVDPTGALEYTRGLVAEYDKLNLSTIVVRNWARTDAQAALAAISTIEPSSFSSKLEDTVATTWARTTPSNVIDNIGAISEKFRLSTLETAFATIARQDPTKAFAKLSSVESYVGNTSSIVKKIVSEWSYQQPDAAVDWVINNFTQDDPQRRTLLMQVLPRLARQDPVRAFELAIAQTTLNEGLGLDHLVIRELALTGRVDMAKKLLPQVKDSSKAAVYGTVGELMVRESEALEALELGRGLTEKQQNFYFSRMMGLWAVTNPKDMYESLEDLPTSNLKSRAALSLILINRKQPVLTDNQIEHARSLLSSDAEAHLNRIVNPN